ncbi:hypothetical protein [Desertibacillus haloalkaliphilus]|uniref:hypothetical protein n=1 Tax=Desertibacillus haloalkaliphilus TaxID=1328930 RepID=UPI001C279152|nr:hypothetical protein [Desertibacillus haloalkaliphilus]MBU8906901.1 hypothetical protein [Desertibacillus haloalkaliphilus]
MGFLEWLSPTSISGVIIFLLGSILTVYLNVKVYRFDKETPLQTNEDSDIDLQR